MGRGLQMMCRRTAGPLKQKESLEATDLPRNMGDADDPRWRT